VVIDGLLVGYLPRADARRFQPVLKDLVDQGYQPQAAARVWGRLVEDDGFWGSVRLNLSEPHMVIPANPPPEQAHAILPIGAAIHVGSQESSIESVAAYLAPEGERWIYVTLHERLEPVAPAPGTIVEVRVDGAKAGDLSPKMSGELLPIVKHLKTGGITSAARAVLRGNRLKADVTVYAARTFEIPAAWLDHPPVVART
jgi:collagen type III alpha